MRRLDISLLLLVTLATWSSAADAKAPLPKTGHHVVLGEGAALYPQSPGSNAQKLQGKLATFEVVGRKGNRVGVKAVKDGCYLTRGLTDYDLTLWVGPGALQQVLAKTARHRFKDGSGYTLGPGLVVRNGKVQIPYGKPMLLAGKAHISTAFKPAPLKAATGEFVTLKVASVGGAPPAVDWPSWRATKKAGIYAHTTACLQLRARGEGRKPIGAVLGSGGLGFGSGSGGSLVYLKIAKGEPVFWPSGERVGKTLKALTYLKKSGDSPKGPCWSVSGLKLCGGATPDAKANARRTASASAGASKSAGAKPAKPTVKMPKLCKKGRVFSFAECRTAKEAKRLRASFDAAALRKQVAAAEANLVKADATWQAGGSVKGGAESAAAAKAALDLANLHWESFIAVDTSIADAQGRYSLKRLRASIKALAAGMRRAQGTLKKVAPYGHAASTACARYHTATLMEVMSEAIANAPLPRGLKPVQLDAYREAINGYVLPIRAHALQGYRNATKVPGATGGCVDAALAGVARLKP